MKPDKAMIGHSWAQESLNIQTRNVAYKLSENTKVWYLTQSRIKKDLPDNKNLIVLEWPNKRPTKLKDFIFAIQQVRINKPDIILVHFASTKALIFAGWIFRVKYRVAWYHTLYGQTVIEATSPFRRWFDVWIRTVIYRLCTHIITQTPFAADDVARHHHVDPKKTFIIPNGMQAPMQAKPAYTFDQPVITFLYVGRITSAKGCDFFIKAFSKFCNTYNNVALDFVGSGDAMQSLAQLIAQLKLQDKVALKGAAKSYSEVHAYMSRSYALVVPSLIDNFPTVIIEAMACGLPVIGANVGGIPYMITNSVDGFLCETEDDWVDKCIMLVNDPELRNRMAVAARQSFEKKYSMQVHVSNVMNFIEGLP